MKFDKRLMKDALNWSEESYCKRLKVGAVIAQDDRIISVGYNGTLSGTENICEEYKKFTSLEEYSNNKEVASICPDCKGTLISGNLKNSPYKDGCETCDEIGYVKTTNKTNEFTVHAEQNAIAFAAKRGISTNNATLYVTHSPCKTCAKLIASVGIKRVVYIYDYRDTSGVDFLRKLNIDITKLKEEDF